MVSKGMCVHPPSLLLRLPGLQEAPRPTGQLVILPGAASLLRLEIQSGVRLHTAVHTGILGITGAFCLGGKGTFGHGHLGHKTAHLDVMPRPGAILCGALSKMK